MQSWWMQMTDTDTVLELRDSPVPTPGPQQLLVRMQAAGLNRGEFHRPFGSVAFRAMGRHHRLACIVEQRDPVGDEPAFAALCALQLLGQCCLAATTQAVAHHHDLTHAQHLDRKFQRGGDAVVAG